MAVLHKAGDCAAIIASHAIEVAMVAAVRWLVWLVGAPSVFELGQPHITRELGCVNISNHADKHHEMIVCCFSPVR